VHFGSIGEVGDRMFRWFVDRIRRCRILIEVVFVENVD